MAESYKIYDYAAYDERSARWAVDFVEKLMHLRWQAAVKDLHEVRDPLEESFFTEQAGVDDRARELLAKDAPAAARYLTDLTVRGWRRSSNSFVSCGPSSWLNIRVISSDRFRKKERRES